MLCDHCWSCDRPACVLSPAAPLPRPSEPPRPSRARAMVSPPFQPRIRSAPAGMRRRVRAGPTFSSPHEDRTCLISKLLTCVHICCHGFNYEHFKTKCIQNIETTSKIQDVMLRIVLRKVNGFVGSHRQRNTCGVRVRVFLAREEVFLVTAVRMSAL